MKSFIASGLYAIAWDVLSSRVGVPVSDPTWWIVMLNGVAIIAMIGYEK